MKPEDVYIPEVYFEFHQQGRNVRVCAIDPRSNTEVSIIGDPAYGERYLKNLAVRKLRYVIAKTRSGGPSAKPDPWEGL